MIIVQPLLFRIYGLILEMFEYFFSNHYNGLLLPGLQKLAELVSIKKSRCEADLPKRVLQRNAMIREANDNPLKKK